MASENFSDDLRSYIERVVRYVFAELKSIDEQLLVLLAKGWDLKRIAKVDRAILRMAAAELYAIEEMPPKVTINEAINLATIYGDRQSGRFVNGVLGKLLPKTPKAKFDPSKAKDFLPPLPKPAESAEEMLDADSPEYAELSKQAGWTLRIE